MGTYTIHEKDVKGMQLPGRFHKMIVEPGNMGSSLMCAGVAFFPGNSHAPEHVHEHQEEILYVLEGRGYMYFDGEKKEIFPGMFMFAPKGVVHSIEAVSKEDLKVLYVFSPPVKQGSYDKHA
jgi:mannose-6-phosphate isomerase-like protein (cupin superfamily)